MIAIVDTDLYRNVFSAEMQEAKMIRETMEHATAARSWRMNTTQPLGRSELIVPRMGIGAMTWGEASGLARFHPAKMAYGGAEGVEEERRAFEAALAGGATLFDTAAMYAGGASERRLGELARGTDALIATKFPPGLRSRAEDMPAALDASLKRLGRSTVDLYQHHFPTGRVDIPRLMGLMADAVATGKVRAVGVSNYSAEQMRLAHRALADRGIPLASNQVEYSLLHRQPETNGVLDACRELGVTLIAYQPLAGGALTGKYLEGQRPSGLRRFMMPYFRGSNQESIAPVVALLREIGARHDKSPAQVAIRWLIENPTILPIPGAKNGRQAAANAEALSFSLTADEVEALDRATLAWRQ
jgi:aryl-alcohol dehydrogenase-like predicted oxidoreductase